MTENAPVWIYPYRLRPRHGSLNSLANRASHEGVLIRYRDGHGCIHPWPELGDPKLSDCLKDLKGPRRRPIVRRAIRCAELDQVARQFEHSLFEDLEVPISHATITRADPESIGQAVEAGFTTVKLKIGRDAANDAASLNSLANGFPTLRWRLDANEAYDPHQAAVFLGGIDARTMSQVDFIEDPCPYAHHTWRELYANHRVALAVDREAAPLSTEAQFMVIKPARDEPILLAEAAVENRQRVMVTSAMDHPIGQTFAAWEAGSLALRMPGLVVTCGLQTHHLFEQDPFTECLGSWSPDFTAPSGHGLGFTDLLDSLPWKKL